MAGIGFGLGMAAHHFSKTLHKMLSVFINDIGDDRVRQLFHGGGQYALVEA
jgi:hypothetical protein